MSPMEPKLLPQAQATCHLYTPASPASFPGQVQLGCKHIDSKCVMHTSACEMSFQLVAALSQHLASLAAELIALCKAHPD